LALNTSQRRLSLAASLAGISCHFAARGSPAKTPCCHKLSEYGMMILGGD
jgi:hypothetical protein